MGKLLCTLPCGMWSVWGRHNIVCEVSVEFFLLTVWSKFVWSIEMNFYLKRINWITKLQRFMVVFSQEQLIIILSWHHLLLSLADVQYKLMPLVESSHKDMLTCLMPSDFRLSKVVKKRHTYWNHMSYESARTNEKVPLTVLIAKSMLNTQTTLSQTESDDFTISVWQNGKSLVGRQNKPTERL